MKNYLILMGLVCLGIAAKAQLVRKPKLNPLSMITEIKPGSILHNNQNNNTINSLQRTSKVTSPQIPLMKLPTLASRIQFSQLDGMPVLVPGLQGLAPIPVVQPSGGFRSEMPIKDLPSQYR